MTTVLPNRRYAPEEETLRVATFRASQDLMDRLTRAAGGSRGGRSAIIREACEEYLERIGQPIGQ